MTTILRSSFAVMLALLVPSAAVAGPIGAGVWSPATTPPSGVGTAGALNPLPFWSGGSWDSTRKGIGYLLEGSDATGLEYLNDGTGNYTSFVFDGEILNLAINGVSGWQNGVFGRRADGAFAYDSGTGRVSNSLEGGQQYALFRLVGPQGTRYFLGIENILLTEEPNYGDYHDYLVTFDVPQPVPEPGTLLLLGSGIAALAARKKAAARKVRPAATA
jgi:PEP-CTERM motif-containing protein